MGKQVEINEAGFRFCSSQDCDNMATHWYVWTNEPVMQCMGCVQRMTGIANVMGHLAPVATVRPMTIAEMQPQIDLEMKRSESLSELGTLMQVYEADSSDANWNAIVQAGKRMVTLQPDWTVRESAAG